MNVGHLVRICAVAVVVSGCLGRLIADKGMSERARKRRELPHSQQAGAIAIPAGPLSLPSPSHGRASAWASGVVFVAALLTKPTVLVVVVASGELVTSGDYRRDTRFAHSPK